MFSGSARVHIYDPHGGPHTAAPGHELTKIRMNSLNHVKHAVLALAILGVPALATAEKSAILLFFRPNQRFSFLRSSEKSVYVCALSLAWFNIAGGIF